MNIIEALKGGYRYRDLRVCHGNRCLIWDELESAWIVNDKKRQRRLVITEDEEEAVKWLLYQEAVPPREAYLPQEGVDKVPGM